MRTYLLVPPGEDGAMSFTAACLSRFLRLS